MLGINCLYTFPAYRTTSNHFLQNTLNLTYTIPYHQAEELPGIKIFHYCGGLNFASKNLFRATLFRKIGYLKSAEVVHDEDNNLTKNEAYEWDHQISNRVSYCESDNLQCIAIYRRTARGVARLVWFSQ